MNRFQFHIARLMRDEGRLAALSVPQAGLLSALDGKSVALVGNARALALTRQGAAIDAADMVVRINLAPMPAPESHGGRCDWLGIAVRLDDRQRDRIAPDRILWMSPKRKRLDWVTATSPGFYLHPLSDYRALHDRIGSPPTTGAMLIDLFLRARLTSLTLHGFDFFASQSLSGSRTAAQVPHDFGSEAGWVADLLGRDPRLRLVATSDIGG